MMPDLVDQDVGDQFFQGDISVLGPLIQDRAAVEEDAAGFRFGTETRAFRQTDA